MPEIRVDAIKLHPRWFYRPSDTDISDLLASMSKPSGLLEPIAVDTEMFLIYGYRRLLTAKALGWETIRTTVWENMDNPLDAMRDENECRRPLKPSEAVEFGKIIEAQEKAKAVARSKAGKAAQTPVPNTTGVSDSTTGRDNKNKQAIKDFGLPSSSAMPDRFKGREEKLSILPDTGRAADKAAKTVGMSPKTYDRAKKAMATAIPEVIEAMNEKQLPISTGSEIASFPPSEQPNKLKEAMKPRKKKDKPQEAAAMTTKAYPVDPPAINTLGYLRLAVESMEKEVIDPLEPKASILRRLEELEIEYRDLMDTN